MMTKEQMTDKYLELYQIMATGKDPKKMKIFGEAEKRIFEQVASTHPDLAESWLSMLESVKWKNYLSMKEAMNIGLKMENQDGTTGPKWAHDAFVSYMQGLGHKTEELPYYNSYALCITTNMIYSDHAKSISQDMGFKSISEVPQEKMAVSCYRKAIELLKDKDENFKIREYFWDKIC